MSAAGAAPGRRGWWRGLAVASCLLLLASVAQFYHPGLGFSALVMFPSEQEELPALSAIPHYRYPAHAAYDGMFYAQIAMDPLLRDPAIDRVLDSPFYRARRILFSWTAYALGLGRPAWILQAYALQNVLCWLLLAWLACRWFPPDDGRRFALWAAVMFSHGLMVSVRMALLDGPSVLLIALAVAASERGRPWLATAVLAVSGLARETNLITGIGLPWPSGWRGWIRIGTSAILILIPLLVWLDYLRSVYWTTSPLADVNQFAWPLVGYAGKWQATWRDVAANGPLSAAGWTLATLVALTAQSVAVAAWYRRWREPWWRVAAVSAILMLVLHTIVWEGYPGAVTRVVLPLTFGFNVLLARLERGFWAWYLLGNLHLIAGMQAMSIPRLFGLT
jgi:hypothetical protein